MNSAGEENYRRLERPARSPGAAIPAFSFLIPILTNGDIASDGCPTREDSYDELVARGDITDGGIGYNLRRIVAQRARTAREGVKIAGELLDRFGYVDSG